MNGLLSLDEMAGMLKKSSRRFRVIIQKKQIPYIRVGNTMLFQPEKVIEHLTTTDDQRKPLPKAPIPPKRGRFAKELGLT